MLKHGALQGARAALDQLEADLRAEEVRIIEEHQRLAERWHQVDVAVKLSRHQHDTMREKLEKATQDAKEIFENAVREADEADRRLEAAEARRKELNDQNTWLDR